MAKIYRPVGKVGEGGEGEYVAVSEAKEGRPDFGPTQVRDIKEVKLNQVFIERGLDPETQKPYRHEVKIKVLGLPTIEREDRMVVQVEVVPTVPEGVGSKKGIYLSDYSVMPSPSGRWNQHTWLEDPSKKENPAY